MAVPSSFLGAKKEGEKKEESSALEVALIRRAKAVVGDDNYCASSNTSLASLLRDLLSSQSSECMGMARECFMYLHPSRQGLNNIDTNGTAVDSLDVC